jgi:hypothetical protein
MSERPLTVSSIVHNWSGSHPTSPSTQTLDNQLPPAITSEVSLRTEIQNTAFCQKNGIIPKEIITNFYILYVWRPPDSLALRAARSAGTLSMPLTATL